MNTEANINEVVSLEEFILRLQQWHETQVEALQHFLRIPADGGIEMEFEGRSLSMEGDVHLAFRAGIQAALDALGSLPFTTTEEEPLQEQLPIEILGVDTDASAQSAP